VTVRFTHGATTREEVLGWGVFDLASSPGRAITRFFFECGAPSGLWTVEIEAVDLAGHTSNRLTGEIVLVSR
jgi:hypothetical protein